VKKNKWDEFRYPGKCLLSDRAKAALIGSANEDRCSPYLQCDHAKGNVCDKDVQKECYARGVDIEINHKSLI
jgi:hypothetical protein